MARREVVEVVCDRCKRVDIQTKEDKKGAAAELEISFQGEKHSYEDLCRRCRDAVKNYYLRITKQDEEPEKAAEKPPEKKGFLPSLAGRG